MKRNVYILVDNTKNEIINSVVARDNKDLVIQLNREIQKHPLDISVSAYLVNTVRLNDLNEVIINPDFSNILSTSVWDSEKTQQSDTVKSDIADEE